MSTLQNRDPEPRPLYEVLDPDFDDLEPDFEPDPRWVKRDADLPN